MKYYKPQVGDRPRPGKGPSIENERFWDYDESKLRFVMKDSNAAMKANPSNPKNTSGPGNYADQLNDAATVLSWRRTHTLDEKDVIKAKGKKMRRINVNEATG